MGRIDGQDSLITPSDHQSQLNPYPCPLITSGAIVSHAVRGSLPMYELVLVVSSFGVHYGWESRARADDPACRWLPAMGTDDLARGQQAVHSR
jgi:hypothetical protein